MSLPFYMDGYKIGAKWFTLQRTKYELKTLFCVIMTIIYAFSYKIGDISIELW